MSEGFSDATTQFMRNSYASFCDVTGITSTLETTVRCAETSFVFCAVECFNFSLNSETANRVAFHDAHIIYDGFLRVLVIYYVHHNLRDFSNRSKQTKKHFLFHIRKAILQFRFNVIMMRCETEETTRI